MLIALYIIIGIIAFCFVWSKINAWNDHERDRRGLRDKKVSRNHNHATYKEYINEEHNWEPTYRLEHFGVRVFNIPFVPEKTEVFYLENEYDEKANLFVKQNIDKIRASFASKGLSFVYLPDIRVSQEMAESMVAYRNPLENPSVDISEYEGGLPSNFLLDYMLHPENRGNIKPGFAWYSCSSFIFDLKKELYTFDYITFDPEEALQNPDEILKEITIEVGEGKIWRTGVYCEVKLDSESEADENFDEEMKNMLEEVQAKLATIRMRGISEAVIARYVKPKPQLSHITITSDFHIILNDFDNMEIKMEPMVKAVFVLFLRHPEGIYFKNLPDHQVELEIIYRAIKEKKNNIDDMMKKKFLPPIISKGIKSLTNPNDNSINEKCTRIKEAFLVHFHDSIAENYYVRGIRANEKKITLSRELVIWE